MAVAERVTYPFPQPEPELTAAGMVERARSFRERLVEQQAEVEQRTYYSPEMHEAFLDAGFYRLYVPRRYGGYEFDVPTYVSVVKEIARGCVSTGWCLGLAMNHALQVGSWWPASAQDAIFANDDFRAGSVAAPVGKIARTPDGWRIDGQVAFASGSPYSTYYMGQALEDPPDGKGEPKIVGFVAPRSEWEMLDDWGDMLGLKGSGSHSLRFDGSKIPADWVIEGSMLDVDVSNGTPGYRLHGNPMYSGRGMAIFTISLATITVGAVYNALDEYEHQMRTRKSPFAPFEPRVQNDDYLRYFGKAYVKLRTIEAALDNSAQQHMELCRSHVEDGTPYTYGDDITVAGIAREVIIQCWDVMNNDLWQTVGASVAREGQRMERVYRDMSVAIAHFNPQLRNYMYGEIGRDALGEPLQRRF